MTADGALAIAAVAYRDACPRTPVLPVALGMPFAMAEPPVHHLPKFDSERLGVPPGHPDRTMPNRTTMLKFGVEVGEVTLSFRKR